MTACPTDAIQLSNEAIQTEAIKCMFCMACTDVCPEHARILPALLQEQIGQMLGKLKTVQNKNEWFL